ncbi:hypothetical protein HAX54_050330, partial [Datura stramonium]|nr:hypothetical protein [Datura stramonium]
MAFTGELPVRPSETPDEAHVGVQGFKPLSQTCVTPVLLTNRRFAGLHLYFAGVPP